MDEIEGLTLTPRLSRSLSEAARVARHRGHGFLGTEHVLLGLLAEPDGIAAQVLAQLGVVEQTRLKLEQIMDSPGYFAPPPPESADLELGQRYGTQFRYGDDGPEPFPLEDPDRVDELRASVPWRLTLAPTLTEAGIEPVCCRCSGIMPP